MKKLTTFRDAGSLIAGLLIGMSIVVAVFVMMVPDPSSSQTVLVIGASIVFALGLVLQAVVTSLGSMARTMPTFQSGLRRNSRPQRNP